MVPAGNQAKRLSSVNHTTKTIHPHHILNEKFIFYFKTTINWNPGESHAKRLKSAK